MDAPLGMADEWPFQMNPQRHGAILILIFLGYRAAQMIERVQKPVFRRGNSGRQVAGDASSCHRRFNSGKRGWFSFHHVMPGAAMNVDVNESRRENHAWKIFMLGIGWQFSVLARGKSSNVAVFYG